MICAHHEYICHCGESNPSNDYVVSFANQSYNINSYFMLFLTSIFTEICVDRTK